MGVSQHWILNPVFVARELPSYLVKRNRKKPKILKDST